MLTLGQWVGNERKKRNPKNKNSPLMNINPSTCTIKNQISTINSVWCDDG